MGVIPVGAAGVMDIQTEEEGLQPELGGLQGDEGGLAGAAQVAQGLVLDRGDVNGLQVAGAQQACELHGVAPVGLDVVTGFLGDERWRDHKTHDAAAGEVAVQDVAARSGLVGDHETVGLLLEPSDEAVDVGRASADAADVGHLGAAVVGNMSNRDGILVHVESDEQRRDLSHG